MKRFVSDLSRLVFENRPWFIATFQAVLILGSLGLAWLLRFNFTLPFRQILLVSAPFLIVIRLGTLRLFNLNHGWWHYSGISDAWRIIQAVSLGTALFYVLMTILRAQAFPRSVYVMEAVLTIGFLSGGRLVSRVLADSLRQDREKSRRIMLIGAGFAAQMIIRELAHSANQYNVIGCVDDDRSKLGIRIQGIRVLGAIDDLPGLASEQYIDEVLIAVPSATGAQMERFVEVCNKARVKFRTVPALKEVIDDQVSLSQLRDVSLEDLLGREPVQVDLNSVRLLIGGRTVAVTGAAGSIGSELCRQILQYNPTSLICIDQNETGLFFLRAALCSQIRQLNVQICVADICDGERLHFLLNEYKPDVIFHAAAYKHVPLMEQNPHEAVKNNVFGLQHLLDIAAESGCETFVLISSDKAVNPISIMGATKRIGELIVASRPANGMRCVSVRFGNVLGSNGSVVPVFQQQLRENRPLTVTHPNVKRFFMTTQEAVALVLQAFAIGNHGDILVLDMGKPISIVDLARNLIRLSGSSEEKVAMEFTGLRPGEKLEEELFYHNEEVSPTSCPKIKKAMGPLKPWSRLCRQLDELRLAVRTNGAVTIGVKINQIVPEYQSSWAQQLEVTELPEPPRLTSAHD